MAAEDLAVEKHSSQTIGWYGEVHARNTSYLASHHERKYDGQGLQFEVVTMMRGEFT
jgi:hypothetical protein